MNIVYIFGNGFDLNLNLKTSYSDFYKYYMSQNNSFESVKKLKADIESNIENWSDLELALGQYSEHWMSLSDVEADVYDLIEQLNEYLEKQESHFSALDADKNKLFEDMLSPELYLNNREKSNFNFWLQGELARYPSSNKIKFNVLTFNYTRIFEKILGNEFTNISLGKKTNRDCLLQSVQHIHGTLSSTPILGLNDIGQILNQEICNDDVLDLLLKPQHNESLGHMIDDDCIQKVKNANLICIFGSSIGETDKLWWEAIGERLNNSSCSLIIFNTGDNHPSIRALTEKRDKKEIIDKFLSKTNLEEGAKERVRKNIYVGINKTIFSI